MRRTPTAPVDHRGNFEWSRHDREQSLVFHRLTVATAALLVKGWLNGHAAVI